MVQYRRQLQIKAVTIPKIALYTNKSMAYPIEKKFVVCVTSSALFDMQESDRVFQEEGVDAYKKYQEANIDNTIHWKKV